MSESKGKSTESKATQQSQHSKTVSQTPSLEHDALPAPANALLRQTYQSGDASWLPNKRISLVQRRMATQKLGHQLGNKQLSHFILRQHDSVVTTVQRDAPEATAEAEVEEGDSLPTFTQAEFDQTGEDFDATYAPVGPTPEVGTLDIVHWVNIDFQPFTRQMMRQEPYRSHQFTPEQLADFAWTPDEQETFTNDFILSTSEAWSEQHALLLNDPAFSSYRARVQVTFAAISDPSMAHTKITALKVPAGAPRFRSFVSGDTATLDIRDPSEEETHNVADERPFVYQLYSFGQNSAAVTGDLVGQVGDVDDLLNQARARPDADSEEWTLSFVGYASSEGASAYNEDLGRRRAAAVRDAVTADLSWVDHVNIATFGEEAAADEVQEFDRMVVVTLRTTRNREVSQNVAAHEAGHMLGLGDEYVDHEAQRTFGDTSSDYDDIENLVGSDAADETIVQNSDSMMASGSNVQRGHYVYFVEAMNQMTGKSWDVE